MTSDIRFRARKKRASFSADRLYTLALLSIPRVCNLLEAPCSLLSLPTRSFTPVLFRPSFSLLSLFHHFLLRVRYVDRLSKTAVQRFITLYFYRGHFRLCAGGIGGKVKHFASIKGEICGMNDIWFEKSYICFFFFFWTSFDFGRIILYSRVICSIFGRDRTVHCVNFLYCIIYSWNISHCISGNRRDILNIQGM